MFQKKK